MTPCSLGSRLAQFLASPVTRTLSTSLESPPITTFGSSFRLRIQVKELPDMVRASRESSTTCKGPPNSRSQQVAAHLREIHSELITNLSTTPISRPTPSNNPSPQFPTLWSPRTITRRQKTSSHLLVTAETHPTPKWATSIQSGLIL